MLKKLNDTVSCSLIAILAIMVIAMGIPLVHPILHNHLGQHHIDGHHDGKRFLTTRYQGKIHACPLCDFLATNQLHSADSGVTIAVCEPIDFVVFANHIILAKSYPLQAEPRDRPAFYFQ